MVTTPEVFMIGGANGAGKTTEALTLLPAFLDVYEFVNADEIARGLNPVKPETADIMAARVMIDRIDRLIDARKNFAFETTCAGRHHVQTLQKCRQAEYRLNLVFLWLPSAAMAVQRVALRIRQGGHAIPEATVRRRYAAGLQNLVKVYLPLADEALVIDNSGKALSNKGCYRIVAEKTTDGFVVSDHVVWKQIEAAAGEH